MATRTPLHFRDLGTLFTGARQYDNFWRAKQLFPTRTMHASTTPFEWPEGGPIELPETYQHGGQAKLTEAHIQETDTVALLVLHDGKVCYERYNLTGGRNVQWMSFSVAKSFTSTLVGIAFEEGLIKSINDPISNYVPVQPGSAYDGVPIRTVMQMSSGARWNEDYSDPNNDVLRFNNAPDTEKFLATMVRESEPDTVFRYNSAETQMLGYLLKYATGRTITNYMQEKLYEPLGMVNDGYWLLDATGLEAAYSGLNMTARDYAKLGELFRNGGVWQGKQIISEEWVMAATRSDSPIRQPGRETADFGYGYQWWIPGGGRNDYTAAGIYNQRIYVDPDSKVTIVKLSANPRYGFSRDEADNRTDELIHLLRAIAQQF